jgi:hypothetical protein
MWAMRRRPQRPAYGTRGLQDNLHSGKGGRLGCEQPGLAWRARRHAAWNLIEAVADARWSLEFVDEQFAAMRSGAERGGGDDLLDTFDLGPRSALQIDGAGRTSRKVVPEI